jgi:hypothetical protein
VHGHAAALEKLLQKLDYHKHQGVYQHPKRKTIFVGDLIDRGTENFKTLEITKTMTDTHQAQVLMGNHEFNALCYHTKDPHHNYLRPHIEKNINQHKEVLTEIRQKGENLWQTYLEWFRRMPLFLETDGFRVVHACWDQWSVDFIRNANIRDAKGRLTNRFLEEASKKGTDTFNAVENLIKGKEIYLPKDHPGFYDKDGHLRKKARVRWWMTPGERRIAGTYDRVTRTDKENLARLAGIKIPPGILKELQEETNPTNRTPVFFGHYWFTGTPQALTHNAACLDYSVARGGHLACYRWDGEQTLRESKFVFV